MQCIIEIEERWLTLCETLDLNPRLSKKWWTIIRDSYQEESRHYHTLEHIKFMLDCSDRYQNKLSNVQEVTLAIFFHE